MASSMNNPAPSRNARGAAVALLVGGPLNLFLHLLGPGLGPLSYVSWLVVSFGILCFCQEMGAARPLNRAGMVLFAAAFCANTLAMLAVDPATIVRAQLLYAFAVLGALVFWSVALMHRTKTARAVGAVGTTVGGGALLLLLAAHLLLGSVTVAGFSQLFSALSEPARPTFAALVVIDSLLCVWCLSASVLLWTTRLAAAGDPAP